VADLGDNISRQLQLVERPYEQVALLVRLAAAPRDPPQARSAPRSRPYRQVLDHEDQNRDAVQALERLIAQPEHELTIASILEPIYKARGEWTKQIGVYEIMAKHAFDPARKIELLHQISELHEIGGRLKPTRAFQTSLRALRDDSAQRHPRTHSSNRLARWPRVAGRMPRRCTTRLATAAKRGRSQGRAAVPPRRDPGARVRDDKAAVATYEQHPRCCAADRRGRTAIQTIHEQHRRLREGSLTH
jgi:hypothetical protein